MILVIGLGITGQSILRFLEHKKISCIAFDTRKDIDIAQLKSNFLNIDFYTINIPNHIANKITKIVLSPGLSLNSSWLLPFKDKGIPIIGDIEIFAKNTNKPIISITGSNGKSTVTTLVTKVLLEAGYKVAMGGNIGVPALDLLVDKQNHDVFVLELSSFQLETTYSLHSTSATVLNICEDHMDRYDSLSGYQQAKMKILNNADLVVLPAEASFYQLKNYKNILLFGSKKNNQYLFIDNKKIMPIKDMALQGEHHLLNALATIALTSQFNIPLVAYAKVFKRFTGLEHRTQLVAIKNGTTWINDSKGTNVGATLSAIKSLAMQGKNVLLIAGGVSKEANFLPLKDTIEKYCKEVILFGRDADLIYQIINNKNSLITKVDTLDKAVKLAKNKAKFGDTVLFSPACASFDQFKNYIKRGEEFVKLVELVNV